TQPGFAGAPIVELNGASAGANVSGLRITAGSSIVRGLVINRFSGNGIVLSGGGGNTIAGNYIGTNAAGTAAQGNANDGIFINGSPNNTSGGTTTFERNVVSGNTVHGIQIEGAGATNNLVRGNYIGTDANGSTPVGNRNGVYIHNPPTTVGGTAAGTGNLISGNTQYGLVIASGGANSMVQGNYIGTNAAGTADLGNGFDGIRLQNARKVTI